MSRSQEIIEPSSGGTGLEQSASGCSDGCGDSELTPGGAGGRRVSGNPILREVRPVYFTGAHAVSFKDEAEARRAGHPRAPDAFGVYEREADGTLTHVTDRPTRAAAEHS